MKKNTPNSVFNLLVNPKKKMYHKIEREQAHGSLLVVENIKERISEVECIFKKVQKKSSFKKSKYCNIVPSMVIY